MSTMKTQVVAFLVCGFLLRIQSTYFVTANCLGIFVCWNMYHILLSKIVLGLHEIKPVMRTYLGVSRLSSSLLLTHWLSFFRQGNSGSEGSQSPVV